MADIRDFLKQVDNTEPDKEVLDAAVTFLKGVNVTTKEQLDGFTEDDVIIIAADGSGLAGMLMLSSRALLRRALRLARSATQVMASHSLSSTGSMSPHGPPATDSFQSARVVDIVGEEQSASVIARLMSSATADVDVADVHAKASLSDLPFHMQADKIIYKVMAAENTAAKTAGRTAFSYVDLTCKELLPLWLPSDMIGGKALFAPELPLASFSTSSVQEIAKAISSATMQHHFFRTFHQFVGACTKWATAAVSMQQMTAAQTYTYLNLLCKIHHEEPGESSVYLVILYDDVLRRSIARRTESKDPDLKMDVAFGQVDKAVLDNCRSRLDAVLQHVGVSSSRSSRPLESADASSLLQKQVAAADLSAKKAEAAAKAVAVAQRRHNETNYDLSGWQGGGGNASGGDGGGSMRKHKRNAFQDNRFAKKRGKDGGGKGKSGKGGGKHSGKYGSKRGGDYY